MRAYYFNNMYLSSIQQGIQIAHVSSEMFVKYAPHNGVKSLAYCKLLDWATNYKTMIVLNAGYNEEIHNLFELFNVKDNPYPWSIFNESPEALGGLPTSIGIVLPENIYEAAKIIRENTPYNSSVSDYTDLPAFSNNEFSKGFTDFDWALVRTLNQYGLAR